MTDQTELTPLLESIARHLHGYEVEPPDPETRRHIRYLSGPGERRITIRPDWKARRLKISGSYPRGPKNYWPFGRDEQTPKITVSMDRPPAALAADIRRRFIGRYHEMYTLAQQRNEESRRYYAAKRQHVARLAEILQESPWGLGAEKNTVRRSLPTGWLTVEVQGLNSIKFELSGIPEELAARMARALMDYEANGKEPTE